MPRQHILITDKQAHRLIQMTEQYVGRGKLPYGRYDESTIEYWVQRFLRSQGFEVGQVRAVMSSGYRQIMIQSSDETTEARIRALIGLG